MVVVGKKENLDKESVVKRQNRIFGSLRLRSVLFIGLVLSVLVMTAVPGSARIFDDTATAPVADQSSGCPCNGQCDPQQAPPVVQPQVTEAGGTINQPALASYSPPGTVQQPEANTPAVNAMPVATSEPKSAIAGPVTNNKSISDMMGTFSPAGLKRFMPSLSVGNNQPVSMPGNGFMEKMKIKWPMFS
jgi:hypothetical protein